MYRNKNLKKNCVKIGNSIRYVGIKREKSNSPEKMEIKMKNMSLDKKVKPLKFKL